MRYDLLLIAVEAVWKMLPQWPSSILIEWTTVSVQGFFVASLQDHNIKINFILIDTGVEVQNKIHRIINVARDLINL